MNILVTIDSNYIHPLKVMLKSLFLNNPNADITIYLMHAKLKAEEIEDLEQYINHHGGRLEAVTITDEAFAGAPLLSYYPKEMYFRLLAYKFLPHLDRILYLDPDILIINPLQELYDLDLDGYLFAAAFRNRISTTEVNKIRLRPYYIEHYYNSGVLLMNLALQRKIINEADIYDFVEKFRRKLILPDQDILNALYGMKIKPLDETIYNYDVRKYRLYKNASKGLCDMDYILRKNCILHFCGKKKPWKPDYEGRFHALYKHYERQVDGSI